MEQIFSVYEVNDYARRVIAGDPILNNICVAGEISGFKHHYASGHLYFQLKDENAAVSCVMFKTNAQKLAFDPVDGMKVNVRCSASIFQRDGKFQLYIQSMEKQGIGDLYRKFEALKQKLESAGIFDSAHKRAIPLFPKYIGIATSADGAALRDMVRIAKRRNPNIGIIVAPCCVQGPTAAGEIVASIEKLNKDGRCDVILCGRGGGSMEDLWCFNEEIVARAIYASRIPVISCVGHETDFTIADFAADRRAATPSMASEIAVPLMETMRTDLDDLITRIAYALKQCSAIKRANLEKICAGKVFRSPSESMIDPRREILDRTFEECVDSFNLLLKHKRMELEKLDARIRALDPNSILKRGYACVSNAEGIIKSAAELKDETDITIKFHDGLVKAITTVPGGNTDGKENNI